MSPDAIGYSSRVRAERVTATVHEGSPRTIPTAPDATAAAAAAPSVIKPTSPAAQPEKPRSKSRRSWHISFRHDDSGRPISWTSDATTLVSGASTSGESSSHPSSPELTSKKPLTRRCAVFVLPLASDIHLSRRRSSGHSASSGAPQDLTATGEETQISRPQLSSPTSGSSLVSKKSWRLGFGHRRTSSSTTSASAHSQPLSDHAVDQLPEPRTRPELRRTT